MKPTLYQACIILLCLSLFSKSWAQPVSAVTIGKEDSLYSKILGEKRHLLISVPASYAKDDFYTQKHYPVLVLLDADTHFRYAAGMVQHLASEENEQIPELIIVGVRNTDRTRDMTASLTGKPNQFLSFLEQDLLPYIDRHYRTTPYRVLAGHSLAGLFTVNCLLDQSRFKGYIAIDPTLGWNNGYLVKKADSLFINKPTHAGRLYLSQANNPFNPGQHTGSRGKAFDAFTATLTSKRPERLSSRYTFYEQDTHFSVPFQSLYDGLLFVFEGYSFPFQTFLSQGSEGVSRHYRQLFIRLDNSLLPPGKVFNQAGLYLLQDPKQIDKGLDILRLNERYYPNSPVVHRSLGQAYRDKGDTSLALQHYKKALAFNQGDEQAKKAITELARQE